MICEESNCSQKSQDRLGGISRMMKSSCLNWHFSKGGKEKASAGAELADADVNSKSRALGSCDLCNSWSALEGESGEFYFLLFHSCIPT